MTDAARKAGRSVQRDFGEIESLQVSQKGPGDFVTATDLRVEKILIQELSKARPFGFLTEETGEIAGKDDSHRWIIDPIDGTMNFMHGVPYFCISIGLEKKMPNGKNEIIAGVVYSPISDEMFRAENGQGAYLNDKRLIVSGRKKTADSLVATGFFWRMGGERKFTFDTIKEISPQVASVRCAGSAAMDLAYVAAGRHDGFWHFGLKYWDIAAGIILVKEAKGMVSEISTKQGLDLSGNILASNGHLHEPLSALITTAAKKDFLS